NPKTWFVSLANPSDVYRTSDGGNTWSVAAHNLRIGGTTSQSNHSIQVGSAIYASHDPLAKSTDNGATWKTVAAAGTCGTMCVTATNHLYITNGDNGDMWHGNITFRHSTIGNDQTWVDDPVPTSGTRGSSVNCSGTPGCIGSQVPFVLVATHDGT